MAHSGFMRWLLSARSIQGKPRGTLLKSRVEARGFISFKEAGDKY